MKASAFRRWPVAGAYSLEQTTRLTGGSDLFGKRNLKMKKLLRYAEAIRLRLLT